MRNNSQFTFTTCFQAILIGKKSIRKLLQVVLENWNKKNKTEAGAGYLQYVDFFYTFCLSFILCLFIMDQLFFLFYFIFIFYFLAFGIFDVGSIWMEAKIILIFVKAFSLKLIKEFEFVIENPVRRKNRGHLRFVPSFFQSIFTR